MAAFNEVFFAACINRGWGWGASAKNTKNDVLEQEFLCKLLKNMSINKSITNLLCASRSYFLHQEVTFCIKKLLCASRSYFVHQEVTLCIKKLLCASRSYFVHQEVTLCIKKLLCASRSYFVHQEVTLCIKKLLCASRSYALISNNKLSFMSTYVS